VTTITNGFKQRSNTSTIVKIITAGALVLPLSAEAIQFNLGDPRTQAFVDTTVSFGGIWRTEDPDEDNLNAANANFEQSGELVSPPLKLTVEAGYSRNTTGVFVRGSYIYDRKIQELDQDDFTITDDGQDEIGNKFQLLDAFVYSSYSFEDNTVSARLGNQVLSWGESTFIVNSLNSINPVDLTKARGAAVELKEILLPLPIVSATLDFGGLVSLDAYYVAGWEKTIVDPVGTFFSTKDVIGEGALPVTISEALGPFGVVPRISDEDADDGGEYGLALRGLIEDWAYMEVAVYYMRQHSHSPYLQVTQAIALAPFPLPDGSPVLDFSTGSYQLIYPEDIDVYGTSFNVDLPGQLGLSLAGEVSYRPDMPLSLGETTFGYFGIPSPLGSTFSGFSEGDLTQIQTTITYQGGSNNWFNADKMTILVEPGVVIANIPSNGIFDEFAFAEQDETSWGYVAALQVEYSDALLAMTLEPSVTFKHDVSGSSPGAPSATFLQDRKSITLAVTATYLTSSTFDIGYTRNWGNEDINSDHDRDFLALTLKHSF